MINVGKEEVEPFFRGLLRITPLDLTRRTPWYCIVGLPLLYASAYYLPPVSGPGAYFLASHDIGRLLLLPTALAVLAGRMFSVRFTGICLHKVTDCPDHATSSSIRDGNILGRMQQEGHRGSVANTVRCLLRLEPRFDLQKESPLVF